MSRLNGAGVETVAAVPVPGSAADAITTAQAYAESVADGVIERDRAGATRPPFDELARLDASGLMAVTVPRAFGGPDLGARVLAVWGAAEQRRRHGGSG